MIEYEVPSYYTSPPSMTFAEGCALQITGQTHRSDLNGKFAVCVCRDGKRTLVMTRGGDTLSVSDSHLQLQTVTNADRVTLVGLTPNAELNGQMAVIENFDADENMFTVQTLEEPVVVVKVKPVNFVLTPEGSEEPLPIHPLAGGAKKRRLLANLVSHSSDLTQPVLVGSSALLSGTPVPGATARLIAIDASVALSNQQPILKRCGTLRKLVHGFPGFAQLVVCLVVKLHLDPTHPGRTLDPADIAEAMKIAHHLTEGKLDGIPRNKKISDSVPIEKILRIADRYCGATHLVFAIDSNFAGVKDSIAAMVHQITGGPVQLEKKESAAPPETQTLIHIDRAMTSLMANRYAPPMSEEEDRKMDQTE